MREIIYGVSTVSIAILLLVAMVIFIEIGHRIGRAAKGRPGTAPKEHINGIQAALLGMLALLLGFTLSLSLQRFDSRSAAVVDEANAIGTAWLRAEFLPTSAREEARRRIEDYLDLRLETGAESTVKEEHRSRLMRKADEEVNALWSLARIAAEEDASPVRTGLFIQSLNEVIDSSSRREAALNRHVPEIVLLLLFVTFLMTGMVVGYSSGIGGYRAFFATYIMVGLIVVLVFIVVDLDRPRRGVIQVSQASMAELLESMRASSSRGAQAIGSALKKDGGR